MRMNEMKVSIFSRIYSWRRVFCPSVDMLCVWCGWKSGRNPSGRDGSARLDVCQMCAAFSCHHAPRFIISVRRSRGPGIGKKGGEGSGGGGQRLTLPRVPKCAPLSMFFLVLPRLFIVGPSCPRVIGCGRKKLCQYFNFFLVMKLLG